MKNVLVTGGAGFIGSHLVRLLIRKYPEYHIVNMDSLTYAGNLENLRSVENNPNISEEEIRKGLEGNICRCTGYHNIVKSIKQAATVMGG